MLVRNFYRYIPVFFITTLLIFNSSIVCAQQPAFQIVKGLPTNEVYDLLIDSKGLLWIAHDQGLSRYDGKTFKHFTNPQQSGRAVSGLIEDKHGRIWCYNFNAQIFWVKNDVMHLLTEYDASKEIYYPRITICQNELITGREKGLFIYDLDSNKGRYLPFPSLVASISAMNDKLVIFARNACYLYSKGRPLIKKEWNDLSPELNGATLILENTAKDDTVLAIKGPANWYYRFVVDKNDIRLLDRRKTNNYINTIGYNNNERWVHTKTESYNLTTGQQINGYNITDIVTDKEGNRWFSSLKTGLMMLPRHQMRVNKVHLSLRKGDYIRNTAMMGDKIIYGTQGGDVFAQDTATGKNTLIFSEKGVGAIEHLYVYDRDMVFVCPSVGLYMLNVKTGNVRQIIGETPVKNVSFNREYTAISTYMGFYLMGPLDRALTDTSWVAGAMKKYQGLIRGRVSDIVCLRWIEERCRAAVFMSFNNSVLASYKSGLYTFCVGDTPRLVKYNGLPVNAISIEAFEDKTFIGTATDKILIYDKAGIRPLRSDVNLPTGSILQILLVGKELWVVTSYGIRVIDGYSEKEVGYYELPGINPASIMDIERVANRIFIAMPDVVSEVPVNEHDSLPHPIINLSYVTVNGIDTLNGFKNALRHAESDLRFYLSAPWYSGSEAVQIAYRLVGNADTSWQYIPRTDAPVFYASLPPGEYRFEARAIHLLSGYNSDLITFTFSIKKPWWRSVVFLVLVVLVITGLITYILQYYYRNRLKRQQQYYEEELIVEKERQKISADIHDELGGTLSGIRLMTEIAEQKYIDDIVIQKELQDIHSSVSSLTQKLREVIWSLSNENNVLESLLDYLLRRSREVFVNSSISFNGQLPEYIPAVKINGERRRHIYLIVKDVLQGMLMRTDITQVNLQFSVSRHSLVIIVANDGKWREEDVTSIIYLKNIKSRMNEVKGEIEIGSGDSAFVRIIIALE